jgi:agmatine/peptidylarginine deiminase
VTINSLKELKQVIDLCRKSGVTKIRLGELEMDLSVYTQVGKSKSNSYINMDFPEANIAVPQPNLPIQAIADKIATDELTPEQLLFYSSAAQAEQ